MISNDLLCDTNIKLNNEIITELIDLVDHSEFYLSKGKFWRYDITDELKNKLQSIFSFEFSDCGFLKTMPNQTYPWHKDNTRISAINMLIIESNSDFVTSFIDNNLNIVKVEYRPYIFTLFNVQQFHSVTNNSEHTERIILSIGFKEKTYQELLEAFLSNSLIKKSPLYSYAVL